MKKIDSSHLATASSLQTSPAPSDPIILLPAGTAATTAAMTARDAGWPEVPTQNTVFGEDDRPARNYEHSTARESKGGLLFTGMSMIDPEIHCKIRRFLLELIRN